MKDWKVRLNKANESFHAETAKLNSLIEAAEVTASSLSTGSMQLVAIGSFSDEEDGTPWTIHLGLVRIKDRWRIARSLSCDLEPDLNWVPLNDCSLEVRLSATRCFEALFAKLIEAREEAATEAKQAAATLEELLESLPGRKRSTNVS